MSDRLTPEPTIREGVQQRGCTFGRYTEVGAYSYLESSTLGDYSYCGQFCFFQNAEVGAFANIAAAVRLGPTMHPMDRPTQHHFTYRRRLYGFDERDDEAFFAWRAAQRLVVGHDTWLGHGAIVMPNVEVGTGAVVGAGAVVTRDVPPYTVAVGVPARVVKRRFSESIAERLIALAWWEWPHEVIRERLADFSAPVEAFLERYEGAR